MEEAKDKEWDMSYVEDIEAGLYSFRWVYEDGSNWGNYISGFGRLDKVMFVFDEGDSGISCIRERTHQYSGWRVFYLQVECPPDYSRTGCGIRIQHAGSDFEGHAYPIGDNRCRCDGVEQSGDVYCYAICCKLK